MPKFIIEITEEQLALLQRDADSEFRTPELQLGFTLNRSGIRPVSVTPVLAPKVVVKKHERAAPARPKKKEPNYFVSIVYAQVGKSMRRRLYISADLMARMKHPTYIVVAWHSAMSITIRPDNGTSKNTYRVYGKNSILFDTAFDPIPNQTRCADIQFTDTALIAITFERGASV